MYTTNIDGTNMQWMSDEPITDDILEAYLQHGREKYPDEHIVLMKLMPDGEDVDIHYTFSVKHRFQRLRRITGYLVGDLARWNNGKRAEEADRVKHG